MKCIFKTIISVRVEPDYYKKIKIFCSDKGITLQSFLETLIKGVIND